MKKLLLIVPLAVLFVLSCEDKEEGVGGLCVNIKQLFLEVPCYININVMTYTQKKNVMIK